MTNVGHAEDEMLLLETAGSWCFRLADGNMSEEEQAAFEHWLDQSDACRRAFDETVNAWRQIDQVSVQPELLGLRAAALEDLRNTNRRRRGWGRDSSWNKLMAIAASLVLLLLSYGVYSSFAFTTYATGTGERRVVLLEDGSRLSIDADSEVLVRYGSNRRELRLAHGRAKFDVAKDTLRPFIVRAGDRIIVATGTEFSVELLARKVHVILYEGHVNILPAQEAARDGLGTRSADEVRLSPGRELVAAIASDQAQDEPNDLAGTLSWEAGFLTFTDEPLQSAVERVNRYTNTKLAIGDGASARVLVNGIYPAGNPEAFIEGVTGVLPIRVEDRDGVRTFVHR